MPELGDKPIQKEYLEMMNELARRLDKMFNGEGPKKTGFVLMVFPFEEFEKGDARCNYISNGADRKDVVVLMKEMIQRFEGQPEMKGTS